MMNDPAQTLYKLYVKKEPEIKQIEELNFKRGIDEQPAPENPVLIERPWVRKKDASGKEIVPDKANTVKIMHWNILADKLSGNLDAVPANVLDWKFRWKLMQQ